MLRAITEVRRSGAEPSLEPFTLHRLDPQACYLRISDRRIDGVPLFDAGLTGAEGVRGRLGPLGSDAEIGLHLTTPGPALARPSRSVYRDSRVPQVSGRR